ncbi:tetratricopeptide repeat protein [Pleurocapsa sp. FMAR1]|uniref:tetratricopeptide repeat protein n=1 Tax=Pleurocapsa sp. FMAR1 TaxID=3040204 RepID=UPI0029C680C9|nr:tetratricopeptide repeat protein [Pleurocapsa sp. FMAR1]
MNLDVAEYLKSAEEYIAQEKWQEAKINFQRAIEIDPHRWDIYFNLGVIFLKQQQYEAAVNKFEQAIRIKPDYDWSYNNLGEAFLKLGRPKDAVQSFIQAVTINQNNPQFYYNLGEALVQKNAVDQALVCFRQALELDPKDHQLQFQLGKSLKNQGLTKEAVECFCRAIKLNPNYTFAYISLRYTKLEPKQREHLINFYQQILIDHPQQPDALANLADLLAAQGNIVEAIAFSRQAIQTKTIKENPQFAKFDWQIKKKAPDFIIIGAGKSGTTSLYRYLGDHQQILLPNKKELRFFDRDFDYGYEWYLAQFPGISDRADLLTGEASPSYFFLPHVAQRIKDLASETKLIVVLRNPVERTISDYYHNQKAENKNLNLEQLIDSEITWLEQKSEQELSYGGGLLSQSLYYYKLKRWLNIFPRNQFLILKSEDLFTNPSLVMREVLDYLSLPNMQKDDYSKHNTGFYPQVEFNLKSKLKSYFKSHNQKLADYLNMNFDW